VATRRPRVPKSAHRPSNQRSLVTSGAPAGHGSYVTGHSAKVIPLDAAPSLHVDEAPADERAERPGNGEPDQAPARTAAPGLTAGHAAIADAAGLPGRAEPVGRQAAGSSAHPAPAPTATPTVAAQTPVTQDPAPQKPAPTAAERRAAARRDLLRRARPGGTPAAGRDRPSSGPSRPAVVEPVPARNFSGRSVALLVVLFVAAVLLAPTLRVFLDQQAELRAVQEDITAQQEEQRELTAQIARWDDPAYIQQQARDRFNLVMPGEKAYMVIGGDEAAEDPVPGPASPGQVNPDMPWADALWDSVVRAGTD
jgi:cell division protein FtsB